MFVLFSLRAPDPFLLLRDPRLLINLPKNWLSQNLDSILKKQRHYFTDKALYNQSYSFSSGLVWMWVKQKVTQSSPTLCDPMDYTVHGILQGRILEWVSFPFSKGSSQPRDKTQVSRIAGRFFTSWATREARENGCESWTIKKAEHWRINAFELWGWRRCLRVPWTARRSNQSILKEISPKYSLEGLMLKLQLILWSSDA